MLQLLHKRTLWFLLFLMSAPPSVWPVAATDFDELDGEWVTIDGDGDQDMARRSCPDLVSVFGNTLLQHDFDDPAHDYGWTNENVHNGCQQLDAGRGMARRVVIPPGTAQVTVEFQVLDASSYITTRIGEQTTPMGAGAIPRGAVSGSVGVAVEILVDTTNTDTATARRVATLVIPPAFYAEEGELFFGIVSDDDNVKIDNFSLSVECDNDEAVDA